jgi:RNA polymerase sigma-70 factor, ECF subfamily
MFNDFLQGTFPLFCSLLLVVGFIFIVVAVSAGTLNDFLQAAVWRQFNGENHRGGTQQTFHIRNVAPVSLSSVQQLFQQRSGGVDVEIEQLKTGDRTAWNRAFEILKAISFSVCCASAPDLNHHDHEDVAAEAITEVVEYIEKVSSFEECKRLVVTISKNRLHDHFRQRSTQKHGAGKVESLEAKEGFDAVDPRQQQADATLILGERGAVVRAALKQVPEQYRKVVEEFYFNGLTQQEIADRHGLKIGSIGVYLNRGLEALHKLLPKDELLL